MCIRDRNIYVCEAEYGAAETEVSQTCIRKIGYKDGVLNAVGQTKIDGTMKDSFCIDEYEGYLRLVTTVKMCIRDRQSRYGGGKMFCGADTPKWSDVGHGLFSFSSL